jgi:hypothetical protein
MGKIDRAKGGKIMNDQNLIPNNQRTPKERRDNARKAGIASGKARKEKADLRKMCQMVLEMDIKGKDGTMKSGAEAITLAQLQKALKGDAKAYEVLRDTAGQKPVEKVEQVNIDLEYDASVEYVKDLMARREDG